MDVNTYDLNRYEISQSEYSKTREVAENVAVSLWCSSDVADFLEDHTLTYEDIQGLVYIVQETKKVSPVLYRKVLNALSSLTEVVADRIMSEMD